MVVAREPMVPATRETFWIVIGQVKETGLSCIGLVIVKAADLSCRVSRREARRENILTRDEAC